MMGIWPTKAAWRLVSWVADLVRRPGKERGRLPPPLHRPLGPAWPDWHSRRTRINSGGLSQSGIKHVLASQAATTAPAAAYSKPSITQGERNYSSLPLHQSGDEILVNWLTCRDLNWLCRLYSLSPKKIVLLWLRSEVTSLWKMISVSATVICSHEKPRFIF